MRKTELRKLRALPATRQMMEKGQKYHKKKERLWSGREVERIETEYELLIRAQQLNGILKIAIFLPQDMRENIQTPRYELFLNVEGQEYITRELDKNGKEVRWLTSMVFNLDGVGWDTRRDEKSVYITKDAERHIKRLDIGGNEKKGIQRIQCWQQRIKDEKREKQERREQLPWDEDMKLVPKEPAGFREWMRKEAVTDVYIIYNYGNRNRGFCSSCRKEVDIREPRHNKPTVCPACKKKAKFKADSRIKTLETNEHYAEMIQRVQGGVVVRGYSQWHRYDVNDYKRPRVITSENTRTLIMDTGEVKRYEYGMYKNKYKRWIPNTWYIPGERSGWWSRSIKLYRRNMGSVMKTDVMKRSTCMMWEELPVDLTEYIAAEKRYPIIEQVVKLGMFRLAKELIKGNWGAREIKKSRETELIKTLKLDRQRLSRLRKMDGGIVELNWLQNEKLVNRIWPDEMIAEFGRNRIKTSDLGFLKPPISYVKCFNYLKKQAELQAESLEQMLVTWRDYINMAEQMKMNTDLDQIQRPKNVKAAHDGLVLIKQGESLKKQAKEIEKKWPKVNKQLEKLKKYEFENGGYCVIAPKNVLDIVKEGTILRHCVHTCDYYFDRIQRDETYLFFLRKKESPDTPWYTLEVEPSGNIRQKRTTGDNQNADFQKAVVFLKHWQQYFQKQLTKEEKELGKKADELRKESYSKLRKDGNRVWHGKLAGQLLADVLEQDFMKAQ